MEIVLIILVFSIIGGAFIYANTMLYLLNFKLEKHPLFIEIIENILNKIVESENLAVFQKTYEELNADKSKGESEAIGQYRYINNPDDDARIKNLLLEIEDVENKYGKPYHVLCQEVGVNVRYKEDFIFPKILLCKEFEIKNFGLILYYRTYFHELGHHFAHKELGNDGVGEELADKYLAKLFRENVPTYFLIISSFKWCFPENYDVLTLKEKILAVLDFVKVLHKEHKLKKQNESK